jgi:hypothetical protein
MATVEPQSYPGTNRFPDALTNRSPARAEEQLSNCSRSSVADGRPKMNQPKLMETVEPQSYPGTNRLPGASTNR